MRQDGHLHVFEDGEARKDVGALKRPADPPLADGVRGHAGDLAVVEEDASATRFDVPGEKIERRGLAGPVRPDDAGNLALLDTQMDVVHSREAVEGFGDALGTE
jgi:hypothetical protein